MFPPWFVREAGWTSAWGLHPNPHPEYLGSNRNLMHFVSFPLLQPPEGLVLGKSPPEVLQMGMWLFQARAWHGREKLFSHHCSWIGASSRVKLSPRSPSPAVDPSPKSPWFSPLLPPVTQPNKPRSPVFKTGPFSILFCPIKILHSQVEREELEIRIHIDLHGYLYIYIPLYRYIYIFTVENGKGSSSSHLDNPMGTDNRPAGNWEVW